MLMIHKHIWYNPDEFVMFLYKSMSHALKRWGNGWPNIGSSQMTQKLSILFWDQSTIYLRLPIPKLPWVNIPSPKVTLHRVLKSDQNNSLLIRLSKRKLRHLQLVQNSAVRLITSLKKRSYYYSSFQIVLATHWSKDSIPGTSCLEGTQWERTRILRRHFDSL